MSRVLIVDDEPRIVSFVSQALTANGFTFDSAGDGLRALELARKHRYDLVILDLLLPGLDGISVLEALVSEHPDQRVLVLSALSDVPTKVAALELGAVDYLPKPFAVAELMARVRARLRTEAGPPASRPGIAPSITLDPRHRTVERDGKVIHLSDREYLVLDQLARHMGQVCTRQELLSEIWGYSFDPGSNIVDVYIGRLRAKLGSDAIATVRNVGYRLVS